MVQAGSHDGPYGIYSSFPLVPERLTLQILVTVIPTSKFLADPFAMYLVVSHFQQYKSSKYTIV